MARVKLKTTNKNSSKKEKSVIPAKKQIQVFPDHNRAQIHLNKKKLSEKFIEEVFEDAEASRVKVIKIQSNIRGDSEFSYNPQISWGDFNVKDIIQKMCIFAKTLSGVPLHPYQLEFQKRAFESVLKNDGEELTLLISRQAGKTEVIAQTINAFLVLMPLLADVFPKQLGQYKKGFKVGLFAPTLDQAHTTHSRMDTRLSSEHADEVLSDSDVGAKKSYSGGTLSVTGPMITYKSGKISPAWKSFCKLQSAAKQAKIESKTFDLLIVEEAQDVDSLKVTKSIHPMGASVNATIIKIGTATSFISDFYRAIQQNRRRSFGKIQNHFEFNYKIVQKFNPSYKAYIKKEIERLGKQSDAFKMSYALEWIIEKGMALTPHMFEEYMKCTSLQFEYQAIKNSIYVAGLDLAKETDSSVLTIARLEKDVMASAEELDSGKEPCIKFIVNWVEMSGDNWETQFHTILSCVQAYNLKLLAVDSTGQGDPIAERLSIALEDTNCQVVDVPFTLKNKHKMATIFYDELRKRRIQIASNQKVRNSRRYKNFLEQFFSCEKVYKGNFMQLEHSKDKGAKDDYVDSLLLLLFGIEEQLLPKVTKTGNPFFKKRFFTGKSAHSSRYDKAIDKLYRRATAKWRRRAS
jgi:hypothetical protein